jgi:ATP-dependent Clp protease protease subunit
MSIEIDLPEKLPYNLNKDITDYYYSYLSNKEIDSFDKLTEISDITNRNLYVLGDISIETGIAMENMIRFYNQVDEQLDIEPAYRVPIKIWINSNGGALDAAFTTCDVIEMSKTPIITINQGTAASAAALIFLAGHRRITFPRSYFMLHEGSAGIGQIDAHKFQAFSDFYKIQREQLKQIILEKTILTEEEYDKRAKDDWWIFSSEAIELQIADEIMEQKTYITL